MTKEEREIQREIDFTDWWLKEHKMEGAPTYADAIAWADRTMIEKAFEWLCANMVDNTYLGANTLIALKKAEFIQKFKKSMEE